MLVRAVLCRVWLKHTLITHADQQQPAPIDAALPPAPLHRAELTPTKNCKMAATYASSRGINAMSLSTLTSMINPKVFQTLTAGTLL